MTGRLLALCCVVLSLPAIADAPRINRIPAERKEAARVALERAIGTSAVREGTVFAELVQCGPRLWASVHGEVRSDTGMILRTIVLFDGAAQAQKWGFRLASTDPQRKDAADALGSAANRVPIEMAVFRNGGEKLLGPLVSRFLTAPARITVRDATAEEIWYLWVLVPYDLEEPIFVIENGPTRVLVTLDGQNRIDWIDLVPSS